MQVNNQTPFVNTMNQNSPKFGNKDKIKLPDKPMPYDSFELQNKKKAEIKRQKDKEYNSFMNIVLLNSLYK
jgi:hypothetical protein